MHYGSALLCLESMWSSSIETLDQPEPSQKTLILANTMASHEQLTQASKHADNAQKCETAYTDI